MVRDKPTVRYGLYGGVITGATIGLPVLDMVNCFCCSGVLLGGLLSIFFATRDEGEGTGLTSADAIQMGAISGASGAFIGTGISTLLSLAAGESARMAVLSMIEQGGLEGILPPGAATMMGEMLRTQGQLSFFGILGQLFTWLVTAPLFGILGAIMGLSLFGRKPRSPAGGTSTIIQDNGPSQQ